MMQKELLTQKDYASVGEDIGHELAGNFVEAFSNAHPEEAPSFAIGRNIIDQILAQPGCAGMRFYNALNEEGQKTTVYVGIDASGKDIVKKVVVAENGAINTIPAIVADRIEWDELLQWLFP
jgi:hypothetical protein